MNTLSDTIADRIRTHRKRLGMTREDLARACQRHGRPSLTFGALTNIETGRPHPGTGARRREITIDELAVIEQALGVRLLATPSSCETCHGSPTPGFQCLTCKKESPLDPAD